MTAINVLPAFGEVPIKQVSIDEARAMKKRDEAYFVNHGKDLRLKPSFQEEEDRRNSEGSPKNWQTIEKSYLPKGYELNHLRITTKQYTFPRSSTVNSPTAATPTLDELDNPCSSAQ